MNEKYSLDQIGVEGSPLQNAALEILRKTNIIEKELPVFREFSKKVRVLNRTLDKIKLDMDLTTFNQIENILSQLIILSENLELNRLIKVSKNLHRDIRLHTKS